MKDKRILWLLVILLIFETITPFFTAQNKAHAADAPMTHLGNKDASFNHFEDDKEGWAKQGNGNYLQLGAGNFIRADVNQLRARWQQDLAPGVKLGATALDSPDEFEAPQGYKIHSIASYAVYKMRTYMVQKEKSGCDGGLYTDPKCNPFNFIGDSSMEDNEWAKSPNILLASHWRYYTPDTYRKNEGLGEWMWYYNWRTAQIRKQGDRNGAGGTPWLKYDFKIVPDGSIPDPDPKPGASCKVDISIGESGSMTNDPANMLADPNGKILESPESGQFSVERYGIPSSEFLKTIGNSEKYLTDYKYAGMSGSVTYTINVKKSYVLQWNEIVGYTEQGDPIYEPRSETVEKAMDFQDPYNVSYWQIGHLNVYSFIDAVFRNYALPGEEVAVPNLNRVTANSNHSAAIEDHVFLKECDDIDLGSQTIHGGTVKPAVPDESGLFKDSAKLTSRPPDVKNDLVEVDGQVSMSDAMASLNAPTPTPIPKAPQVEVEQFSLLIDPLKVNKWQTSSSITARYRSVHTVNTSVGTKEFTGNSPDKINTVTVHTPVVMYARASDDKKHDQRTAPPKRSTPANPDTDRHAFILDRPFTVALPTFGQHLDVGMAPGYGNRDYAKYTRQKQVKFPFDVYSETKAGFYPKDTWINVPIDMTTVNFFLPVWVPEGQYTVKFRSIAINAPGELPEEHHANLNMSYRTPNEIMANHVAYDTIEVDVVGRLYDFHVTDILDFNWGEVFRTTEGLIEHTGNTYWVGDKDIDGNPRKKYKEPFSLPVRHGSHPNGIKNLAVKTGYQFKFDMKTKGDMWRENDAIRITPSFYFVDKNGRNPRKVDVYYHNDNKYFTQIGSDEDTVYREVKLNEPLRNVPRSQLWNNGQFYYRHPDRYGFSELADQHFEYGFVSKYEKDITMKPTPTGPYGWQILNWNLRTFMGPYYENVPSNAMVDPRDAVASEQTWYGEYSLPADVYIVDKDTNIPAAGLAGRLNKNHPIFLRNGYLVVNFNIESIQNGNVDNPHLQYIHGELSNQWKREGFKNQFEDPYGYVFQLLDGDVIFYHADQSSYDDFKAMVTH